MPPAYLSSFTTQPIGTTRPCDGKHAFAGRRIALQVARDMAAATVAKGRDKRPVSPYRCRECGAWHVAGGSR